MAISNAIKKRRSTRSYLDKKVKHSDIFKILEAGHYAPSAGNTQHWRFIVVQDGPKNEISRCCQNQLWMQEAPTWIVICSDNTNLEKQYSKNVKKFSTQGCAAAIQNMLLQAQDLGLGSCWVAVSNPLRVKHLLKIPDYVEVEAIITIGYSKENPIEKRHKLEEITFFEKFGNRTRDVSLFPLAKYLKKLK